jgi:hypothetical protein
MSLNAHRAPAVFYFVLQSSLQYKVNMNAPDAAPPSPPPLLPDESDRIINFRGAIDAMLRQPARVTNQLRRGGKPWLVATYALVTVLAGVIYGLVIGMFSGGDQLWVAPVKVATGFLLSAAICLPSLYIFSALAGSTAKFGEVCGLVAAMIALMTVLLIGFAPVAWVFSQSTSSVSAIGTLHLVFWMVATYFGLRFLNIAFGSLTDKTGGLSVWILIFILVMLQMTTTLRPLVGIAPTFLPTEKKFFLMHWHDSMKSDVATSRRK